MSALHSKQTIADGIHSAVSVTYASSASMAAATGFVTEDIYKLAWVLDTKSLWMLTTFSPANWTLVNSTFDVSASYLVVGTTGSLPNERALAAGPGIAFNDGGAGGLFTISSIVRESADVSGSYVTIGNTGSLPNERALTAGPGIDIIDGGAGGAVTIRTTGGGSADVSASYIVVGNTGSLPNERALAAGPGIAIIDGGAGGSVTIRTTGEGAADVSGSYVVFGATGSLPNERVLTAGPGITIIDGGPGEALTVRTSGAGAADVSASYVTVGTTGSLPNERFLSSSYGITMIDGGAGGAISFAAYETPENISGTATVHVSYKTSLLTTTGAGQVVTVPNGIFSGQVKYIIGVSGYGANTSVITPTTPLGFTTATFDANGEAITLLWTGTAWVLVGIGTGVVIA